MGAQIAPFNRYRHVAFVNATARHALNLGARRGDLTTPWQSNDVDGDVDDDLFLSALLFRAGLRAGDYRPCSLRRRLPACLRALRAESAAHARWLVRRSPQLVPVAIDALLLGVTEFFRDAQTFECLANELRSLVPAAGGQTVRMWSAACSDGAELYSVAMLLDEQGVLDRCELLGTDCREDALRRAASGAFAGATLRGLSPHRAARYFESGLFRVISRLRQRVSWRRADVLTDAEPGPWNVILCRNLAMYLQPMTADRLWRRLSAALRPGGLLVVGKAERPTRAAGLLPVGPGIYRRYGEP